ncbi:MAG: hypothetical protein JJD92_12710 [Frankiaceae bacterium]|nr:hypothetical protein [Frankiaceae bacterium]
MALEESSRRLLYASAAAALGTEAADVLMEHLPPAGWADLARRGDVEHETGLLRADIGTVRAEIGTLRAEMTGEFAGVRAEMAGLGDQLRTEIHAALASQTRWMVTVMLALGALFATVNVLGR